MTEDPQLENPYWWLDEAAEPRVGPARVLRSVAAAARPVVQVMRRAAPRQALLIVILIAGSGIASAFGLLATTDVLGQLFAAGPTSARVVAAVPGLLRLVAAYGLAGILGTAVTFAHARLGPAVRRVAEEQLLGASLGAELAATDDPAFHDRMHRARDRGLFHFEQVTHNLVELASALVAVPAAALALAVLHPVLLLVLGLAILPEAWATLRSARFEYGSMGRTVMLVRRIEMMIELATRREAAPELRACQAEPFVLEEYRRAADLRREHEVTVGLARARTRAVGRVVTALGIAATFAVLGLLLHAGWLPLAVAGTAVIAIRAGAAALGRWVLAANQLVERTLYIADYQAFLTDAAARARPALGRSAPAAPGEIRFERVSFGYPGSPGATLALRDIDLVIAGGQTIALVGENGSGKTTLAKLLAGLYRPTAGRITWDGVDIADLDPSSFADRIVMVQQQPLRWPGTARANVRLGRHDRVDAAAAALRAAAARAGADDVVERLGLKWDTIVSKYYRGGVELSGGEWQRLAVARGLYRDAPVLIWDEPTAALDAKAERAVYDSLRELAGGRTVILITHRLASVRRADRIYLLHEGQLAESGRHDELVAQGGRYAELYRLQLEMYGDG